MLKKYVLIILIALIIVIGISAQTVNLNGDLNYKFSVDYPVKDSILLQEISLVYNSSSGNGIVGLGWTLTGFPTINRDPSYYINFNSNDRYMYDGQKLIYNPDTGSFHTEVESFLRIEMDNFDNPQTWIITSKNGTKYYFGKITTQENNGFIESIDNPGKALQWRLSRVEDIYGNYVKYEYLIENGKAYPDKITYTLHTTDLSRSVNVIKFSYEERMDKFISYNPCHFELSKRLSDIEIYSNNVFYKHYLINYIEQNEKKSKIKSIQETGHSGNIPMYITTFEWSENQNSDWSNAVAHLLEHDTILNEKIYVEDISGDGLTDIVTIEKNGWRYYIKSEISNGDGTWEEVSFEIDKSFLINSVFIPCDINGDGLTDFVSTQFSKGRFLTGGVAIVQFLSNGDGTWNCSLSRMSAESPPEDDLILRVAGDVNGDGLSDIINIFQIAINRYDIVNLISNGEGSWSFFRNTLNLANSNSFNCYRVQIGDFNGDELTDLIFPLDYGSKLKIISLLSKGDGSWIEAAVYINDEGNHLGLVRSGDFNGDGLSDIVTITRSNQCYRKYIVKTYLSRKDGTWILKEGSFLREFWGSYTSGNKKVLPIDINNDGLFDIRMIDIDTNLIVFDLFSNGDGTWKEDMNIIDNLNLSWNIENVYTGNVISNNASDIFQICYENNNDNIDFSVITKEENISRIEKIVKRQGASIDISYKNIGNLSMDADFTPIKITADNYPFQSIPQSKIIVEKIEINDGMNSPVSSQLYTYKYHNGLLQTGYRTNRKVLGFEKVKKINPDSSFSIKYKDFENNGDHFEDKVENYGSNGNLYTRILTSYVKDEIIPVQNGFPSVNSYNKTDTHTYNYNGEGGADGSSTTPIETWVEYAEYDDYGNLTKVINHGDTSVAEDDTAVFTKYAVDTSTNRMAPVLVRKYGYALDGTGFDPSSIFETYNTGLAAETEYLYYDSGNQTLLPSGQVTGGSIYKKIQRSGEVQSDYPDVVTTYDSYDIYGNLLSWTDGEGNTSSVTYDSDYHAYPEVKTDALGNQTETFHDTLMRPVRTQDINGQDWYQEYDNFGRVTATISPGDSTTNPTTKTEYHDAAISDGIITYPSFIKTSIKQDNISNDYIDSYTYFDGLGRKIQIKIQALNESGNSTWKTTDVYYDNMGRNDFTSVPYETFSSDYTERIGRSLQLGVTTEFDEIGRAIKKINTDTTYNRVFYGKRAKVYVDENDHVNSSYIGGTSVTEMAFSGMYNNNPADYMDPGSSNPYSYATTRTGIDGVTVEYEDAQGYSHQIKTVNDMLGRKMSYDDPDMGLWSYTYDGNGNIKTQTDARGAEVEFEYDELNRITRKVYSDFLIEIYNYDGLDSNGTPDGLNHGYCEGRLTSISYNGGSESYVYDERGRVTSLTRTIDSISKNMSYEYDSMDRITKETYPDGEELTYTYADDGNLISLQNNSNPNLQYIYNLNYTLNGKIKNFTYGNGVTTSYDYYDESRKYDQGSGLSNSYRLKSIAVENSSGTALANTAYNYDNLDNVVLKEMTNDYGDHYAEEFEYDFLNRLTRAESYSNNNIDIYGTKTYTYDSQNNILTKDGNTYSYDHSLTLSPHALQSVTGNDGTDEYQYDENGNVITKLHNGSVVRTILYDGANRVSSISDGGSFVYDTAGQRIKKTENGITTYYFFDTYEEEHDGTDVTVTKYYFANGMRIAKATKVNEETAVLSYFHTDHLGSSVMMTNEAGTRTMSSTYTPYGGDAYIAGTADIKYKFTGQEEDSATGLYYYGARYYDPALGRFLQADTYLDGLNRYAYCHDNPVMYTDPSGNTPFFAVAIGLAAGGIIMYAIIQSLDNLSTEETNEWISDNLAGVTVANSTNDGPFIGYYDYIYSPGGEAQNNALNEAYADTAADFSAQVAGYATNYAEYEALSDPFNENIEENIISSNPLSDSDVVKIDIPADSYYKITVSEYFNKLYEGKEQFKHNIQVSIAMDYNDIVSLVFDSYNYYVLRDNNSVIIDHYRNGGVPFNMIIMDIAVCYNNGAGYYTMHTNRIKSNAQKVTLHQALIKDKEFFGAIGTVSLPFMNKTIRVGLR